MLQESPVPFVRKDDVIHNHLRVVLRQDAADVEALSDVADMEDEHDKSRLLNLRLQKLDEIRVRIDDGDDRLSCHDPGGASPVPGPDEMAGILDSLRLMTDKPAHASPGDDPPAAHRPLDEHGTLLRKNIRAIAELEHRALHQRGVADRVSDAISRATGSAAFAVSHAIGFTLWIVLNVGVISGMTPFDPFPFSFLTLVVSLEAIFLSVFVLMSQNRMTRQAEKRAHLDLQVDMLAEQELTAILRMVQGLCEKHGVEVLFRDDRLEELVRETDVHTVAAALEDRLPDA